MAADSEQRYCSEFAPGIKINGCRKEMNSSEDKLGLALKWLQEAEMRVNYLRDRFHEDP